MGQARADIAAAVAVLRQLGALGWGPGAWAGGRPQDRDAARVYAAVAALAVALVAAEGRAPRGWARVAAAAVRVAWTAGRWAGRGS